MPELPEVETIRRGLEKILPGRRFSSILVRRPDLRGPIPVHLESKLKGLRCQRLIRRGKYIVCEVEGGHGFCLHLGMSGRVHIIESIDDYKPSKHDHVVFKLDDGSGFVFNDARRFGMIFMIEGPKWRDQAPFNTMGPEPLEAEFTGAALFENLKKRKTPVKIALLDQNIVSGVGNIYASEALYHAKILPNRTAGSLTKKETNALVKAIKYVLNKAIDVGGSTLKDYRHADGALGYFQHMFSVYDREGRACPDCTCDIKKTGGVIKTQQGGRSTFYCPRKQK